ncbi:hypothetical protein TELCIR_12980 [Teladorsagia circumcincta]|uniref:leucine--tRNA ligase n=1 Tax=Teladorsagia circumcincta TaxID=45464 RepID=A0A2G9U509_TELCI|nr:hypothetical protein TELCIR_12980 [Teladorsagia circumcincta]
MSRKSLRQRSWGTPIPMILSPDGKTAVPLSNDQLPLLQGREVGEKVPCDRLKGGEGYYEADTLDTFFDSTCVSGELFDAEQVIYGFVASVNERCVHSAVHEPFRDLIPQGIVRGKTFIDSEGRYVPRSEVIAEGVDPLEVLEKVGVDMARLQLLDAAAPRQAINWEESGLKKWIDRMAWIVSAYVGERKRLEDKGVEASASSDIETQLRESYNFFVRHTSICLEELNLHNTALKRLQGFTNVLRKLDPSVLGRSVEAERCIYALVTMMQVFTPYLAAEFWAALQSVKPVRAPVATSTLLEGVPWPQVDPDCAIDFNVVVNGEVCGRVAVPRQGIEHLSLQELIDRAKTVEHREFFEKLEEKGLKYKITTSTVREGRILYV